MHLLPHLMAFAVVFFTVAGLGAAVVVGLVADFLVRNRARRLHLRMPVLAYYRHLPVSH
jgi:hypothetical protein